MSRLFRILKNDNVLQMLFRYACSPKGQQLSMLLCQWSTSSVCTSFISLFHYSEFDKNALKRNTSGQNNLD